MEVHRGAIQEKEGEETVSLSSSPLTTALSHQRLCCNRENDGKCYAELVSASNLINTLLDPEINSG
jgi:hypothetical protein